MQFQPDVTIHLAGSTNYIIFELRTHDAAMLRNMRPQVLRSDASQDLEFVNLADQ